MTDANATMPPVIAPGYLFQSDPTCREINGRFWVFCTHDQTSAAFQAPEDFWDNMYSYQAYSTTDFTEWISHGSILSRFDIAWADANALWDGDAGIAGPDGKFYAYMPFRCRRASGQGATFKMAAMVADQPEGPYRDALGRPFLTDEDLLDQGHQPAEGRKGNLCLSPTVVYDEENAPWLLFGQFKAFIAPLAPTMTELAGPIRELDIPLKGGDAVEYIEGPMLDRVNGRWLFTYMTYKNWQGVPNPYFAQGDPDGPYIQVCESNSMFGPFTNPRHWIYPLRPNDHNVQHCLAKFRDRWIVAYHLPWKPGSQHRQTAVSAIRFDESGRPLPLHPATDPGLGDPANRRLVLAAKAKRFAQEFSERHGGELIMGPLKSHHLRLGPGDWVKFPNMRFAGDETRFELSIPPGGPEPAPAQEAHFQVRLDTSDGPLLADSRDDERSLPFKTAVSGDHDLYITGHSGTAVTLHSFRIW